MRKARNPVPHHGRTAHHGRTGATQRGAAQPSARSTTRHERPPRGPSPAAPNLATHTVTHSAPPRRTPNGPAHQGAARKLRRERLGLAHPGRSWPAAQGRPIPQTPTRTAQPTFVGTSAQFTPPRQAELCDWSAHREGSGLRPSTVDY